MIVVSGMAGISPTITPELLGDNQAQVATNVVLYNGGVRSLRNPVSIVTPSKSGAATTIFRYGKRYPETQYWFKWPTQVNVCYGPIAGDTEERVYYTGDGAPQKTKFDMATGSGTSYPVASYALGVPAPTDAPVTTQVSGTGPEVQEERAYIYTNVTAWGEESAPSPAAIGTATSEYVLELSGFSALPTGAYNIVSRRIYRSVTSSSGTNYYFVGEIQAGTDTFLDDLDIASVGEPLVSLYWDTPPDDLAGLVALPSGALCGFSGKEVCFSVIGAPYAWPIKYRLTCDYNIVAVVPMGQGVVVLTDGYPYFINTGDPESAQMIRIDEEQSCVSARSAVPYLGGVLYASPDGLVMVTQGGCKLLTQGMFDHASWQALNPETLFAAKHDGRYYGFLSSGGFILDAQGNFTSHTITADSVFVDPVLDQMYIAIGTSIYRWDAGDELTHAWKSKRRNLGMPTNFSCAQIKANSFDNTTFKLYVDGALKFSTKVTSPEPFRLPSGFRARIYEEEITGTDHWVGYAMAQSMEELKNV